MSRLSLHDLEGKKYIIILHYECIMYQTVLTKLGKLVLLILMILINNEWTYIIIIFNSYITLGRGAG